MTRAKIIILLAFVLGLCLAGCSKKDFTSQNEPPSAVSKMTIAVIPKGTIHEFWKTVHAGAEMAAQELQVKVL